MRRRRRRASSAGRGSKPGRRPRHPKSCRFSKRAVSTRYAVTRSRSSTFLPRPIRGRRRALSSRSANVPIWQTSSSRSRRLPAPSSPAARARRSTPRGSTGVCAQATPTGRSSRSRTGGSPRTVRCRERRRTASGGTASSRSRGSTAHAASRERSSGRRSAGRKRMAVVERHVAHPLEPQLRRRAQLRNGRPPRSTRVSRHRAE